LWGVVTYISCDCNLPKEACWFNNSYKLKYHFLNSYDKIRIDKNIVTTGYKKSIKEESLMSSILSLLLDGAKLEIEKNQLIFKNKNNLTILKSHTDDNNPGFFKSNVWYIDWVKEKKWNEN
jgi:hypothetical protein